MDIVAELTQQARNRTRTVALPEGNDTRIIRAARRHLLALFEGKSNEAVADGLHHLVGDR